jgi:hypothetical protein
VGSNTTREPVRADVPGRHGPAREAVAGRCQAHALGLIRLGVVMLGDQAAAEDVVQEAFCGQARAAGRSSSPTPAASEPPNGPGTILGVLTGNAFTPIPHGTYDAFLQIAW